MKAKSRRPKALKKKVDRKRIQLAVPRTSVELNQRVQLLAPQLRQRGLSIADVKKWVLRAVQMSNVQGRSDTTDRRAVALRALKKAADVLRQTVAPIYHEDIVKRAAATKKGSVVQFPASGVIPPGHLSALLIKAHEYLESAPRMRRQEVDSERLKAIVHVLAACCSAHNVVNRPGLIMLLLDRVVLDGSGESMTRQRFNQIYYSLPRALTS